MTTDDYPVAALRDEAEGRVRARLIVGTDGLVRDCFIDHSSDYVDLDSTTCSILMQRARFSPARDGNGVRVEGQFTVAIVWRLPEDLPMLPDPGLPVEPPPPR